VTSSDILTEEDISYVCDLVTQAGQLAVQLRNDVEISWKSNPNDKVTSADIALSQLLVDKVTQRFPKDVIVSEEDATHGSAEQGGRLWLIDPIDGTDNYIANDGQYSVMVGLLNHLKPIFGWVFCPTDQMIYYGGPGYGAWKRHADEKAVRVGCEHTLNLDAQARVVIGWRDRKKHPWITELPQVKIIKTGSIGLKVAKILDGQADLFIHLSGKLKTWDTAGPAAIALGGGLEVGALDSNELLFPIDAVIHSGSVIMGCPGSIEWSRSHLAQAPT
jgi:3'(2'), 5'-bisphosphate nucleotidase